MYPRSTEVEHFGCAPMRSAETHLRGAGDAVLNIMIKTDSQFGGVAATS